MYKAIPTLPTLHDKKYFLFLDPTKNSPISKIIIRLNFNTIFDFIIKKKKKKKNGDFFSKRLKYF